ncbi:hypothetical protein GPECTOR_81g208 [Gonium pectorale]|uniref:Uncharacterized protein n=1 Tax=Gonium pectorale TaxID=33097 RepID=A0A150G1P6_GONPE|nr:hypothetical protein GPECTOR_81g208 [Gonium pectorale]|eukprot:KXZ43758.1 hypothetical protein GPECTOR_81g208 [Gonium pectorale]
MPAGEVCCGANSCGACCCFYMLGGFVPTITAALFLVPVPLSCSCFVHTGSRGWIRQKYGIPGTCCGDCLITTFCIPCALCQEHRELVIRGMGVGGVEMQRVAPAPIVVVNNVQPQQPYPADPAPGYPVAK